MKKEVVLSTIVVAIAILVMGGCKNLSEGSGNGLDGKVFSTGMTDVFYREGIGLTSFGKLESILTFKGSTVLCESKLFLDDKIPDKVPQEYVEATKVAIERCNFISSYTSKNIEPGPSGLYEGTLEISIGVNGDLGFCRIRDDLSDDHAWNLFAQDGVLKELLMYTWGGWYHDITNNQRHKTSLANPVIKRV